MVRNIKAGTFDIFRKKAAAKFSLIPPTRGESGFVIRTGAVLLEAAPAKGVRPDGLADIDWTSKITFAIGVADVCQLLDPKTQKLIHSTDDTTKSLSFSPGEGAYEGTWQMNLTEASGEQSRKVFIGLSAGEMSVLQILLKAALPSMLGWELPPL